MRVCLRTGDWSRRCSAIGAALLLLGGTITACEPEAAPPTMASDGHPSAVALVDSTSAGMTTDWPAEALDHVIVISVDGLRGDMLEQASKERLPAFHRLLLHGPHTLNARADCDHTITLPNHVSMVTGRPVEGEFGHNWTYNNTPPRDWTLHNSGAGYIASMFDVAHDAGVTTAVFAGKIKFILFDRSYDDRNGAVAAFAAGEENAAEIGRDKIDDYRCADDPAILTTAAIDLLSAEDRSLIFLHFAAPDLAGHGSGWDLDPGSEYCGAIAMIDKQLGVLLDAIGRNDELKGRTAIILTADHGGGEPFRSHTEPDQTVNFRIPFVVWIGESGVPADLYAINPTCRLDPGDRNPRFCGIDPADPLSNLPPIRSGDAGNLALKLLGLPAIPGSIMNVGQELRLAWRAPKDGATP